ncbi:MAG: histidine--tRNA ligase [Desulfobacterales bacterium]|nr:histidine--tRNA ligase [Desulfobacterales bacterium]
MRGDQGFLEFTTIKGFKDILPEEAGTWQRLESEARRIFRSFGFQEIKPPLLEMTELFSRSIGEETDIVSKEMYSLSDSKGRSMTLRPEATASLVRAYIQHRLYQKNPVQKLFTIGPMFRHERPQKGRFRQFHQIDAEILGDPGPLSDAEIIVMAVMLFEAVGLGDLSLLINSLGCPECRTLFREDLRKYLVQKSHTLCTDCERRAVTNPLRVFDCKVDGCKEVVSAAPSILDYICPDCSEHFRTLQGHLEAYGIPFTLNHTLVRGLDYYTRTTFEIQTERLGAQNAVLGGGRYDGLSRQLGGPDHPAIGFALGLERLVALLDQGPVHGGDTSPDLFMVALGDEAGKRVFKWANDLRRLGIWVEMEYTPKGLKAQLKRADRIGAKRVLIVGDDELAAGKGILRDMQTKTQQELDLDGLVEGLKALIL